MSNELESSVSKNDIDEALQSQVELAEQYLTFYMDQEEFGVNILSVQEIRGWEAVTAIPNSAEHVLGVMNLRGTVVPVVDLRMCFGLENLEYSDATVVIILNIKSAKGGNKVMGVVVDAVSDVHNFADKDIQPAPELKDRQQGQYVRGLGSTAEHMVILLDLNEGLIYDTSTTLSIH